MALITINIPDAVDARVIAKFSQRHGYQAKIAGPDGAMIDNPETRRQFAKRVILRFIMESVKTQETQEAAAAATLAATAKVDAEIQLT